MNISWRRRELVGLRWPPIEDIDLRHKPRNALEAMLGQSNRVDGKPKRVHIASLGSIDETAIDHAAHRYAFWRTARNRLAELRLSRETSAEIVTKLADRVAPIGADAFIERAAWLDLYLVNEDAAEDAMQRLRANGAIDDREYRERVEFVAPFLYARDLHRHYQEALKLAQAKRKQARMNALAALRSPEL